MFDFLSMTISEDLSGFISEYNLDIRYMDNVVLVENSEWKWGKKTLRLDSNRKDEK